MTNDEIFNRHKFSAVAPELGEWPEDLGLKYIEAEEADEIVTNLIDRYRKDLKGYSIVSLFKKSFKAIAQVTVQSELNKTLSKHDSVIQLGFEQWVELTKDAKYRVILHCLEEMQIDPETGKFTKAKPPVAQFPLVMQVFGPATDSELSYLAAWEKFKLSNGGKDHPTATVNLVSLRDDSDLYDEV